MHLVCRCRCLSRGLPLPPGHSLGALRSTIKRLFAAQQFSSANGRPYAFRIQDDEEVCAPFAAVAACAADPPLATLVLALWQPVL